MKDWVTLLTAIIQLITALKIYQGSGKRKKGTLKRKRRRQRR